MAVTETPVVLVGMSIADVQRRDELAEECGRHAATLAFLQQGEPAVGAELTRLADTGASAITLAGVSLGPIAPAHSWLRRIAAHWWRERAGARPDVYVATRLADSIDAVSVVLGETKAVSGGEPGLTSDAWERVPGYRHQVLVCRGPRCTASGSVDTLRSMVVAMMEHGLTDDDVLVVHTGCQFPCNHAPVWSVQPDDVWYGHVAADDAKRIVDEHLVGGEPVEGLRLRR